MIVVMRTGATREQIQAVTTVIEEEGLEAFLSEGDERTVIGVVGPDVERVEHIASYAGVEQVIRVTKPYKLASREHHPDRSRIRIGDQDVGADGSFIVMAGPCAVESREQLMATAHWVKREGAGVLRGGAFKPRTSPYAFQGLGVEGLRLLAEARQETGLPVVSEVTDPGQVELFEEYVDVLQVGARNMHNFVLLRAVGQSRKPVLLKRGFGATIEEWLMAAEYVLSSGNPNVVLCERGIRTFEPATRNTLDISAVPVLRELTHLPIVIDPSHGTGHRRYVRPMALAAAAVGADGLIIEVHPDPPRARSDADQSLSFPDFGDLMDDLRRLEFLRAPDRPRAPSAVPVVGREELRGQIDAVDGRLAALLEERARLAVAVQQTRSADDHGHDVGRERALLERAAGADGGVLTPDEVTSVFTAILRASRSAQRRASAGQTPATASSDPGRSAGSVAG
jgi:3-deoxy-7-phosphoheptulonate synthase